MGALRDSVREEVKHYRSGGREETGPATRDQGASPRGDGFAEANGATRHVGRALEPRGVIPGSWRRVGGSV